MRKPVSDNAGLPISLRRLGRVRLAAIAAALMIAPGLCAQTPQAEQPSASPQSAPATVPPTAPAGQSSSVGPVSGSRLIAIVPLDSKISGHAFEVTGDLQVSNGRAFIAANGTIASGEQTTHVTLPYRGTLQVCAYTTVKLTANASVPNGEVPGLMLAMEHGAVEMSLAGGRANTQNADFLLTPDFRILISGPGAADLKVRLGPAGDTCVDNAGAPGDRSSSLGWNPAAPGDNAPYVLVSSVFDGGAYRVQAGQRVMFQHGSLHEVVDQEKESCGCPPAVAEGNEFPLAQSEGLAPLPKPAPAPPSQIMPVEPLVYNSANHAPQAAEPASTPAANEEANAPKAATEKKPGFFTRVGRFFKRIFGAE